MSDDRAHVSDADRRAFTRQVVAMSVAETDDEGTPDSRARRITEVDSWRQANGLEPLSTEPELHRLARDRGLLRRVP